jgi:hypothetical protein
MVLAILLSFLVSYPVWSGYCYVGGDVIYFTIPSLELVAQHYQDGSIQGWNPFMGTGQPFTGDLSFPFFYPPCVLLLWFSPPLTLTLLIIFHQWLCIAGTYFFLRSLERSRAASFIAAMSFALGGVGLSHMLTPPFLFALPWIPLFLLAFKKSLDHRSLNAHALATLPLAMIVSAGALEYGLMAALLALVLIIARPKDRLFGLLSLGVIGFAALLLTGVILIPTLSVFDESVRSEPLRDFNREPWFLHPIESLSLGAPYVFAKNPDLLAILGHSKQRPWYPSLHMGSVPLVMVIMALPLIFEKTKARYWLLVPLLLFPIAHGHYSPIYEFLDPLFSRSRYPAKFFMPIAFALVTLSAYGFDRRSQSVKRPPWVWLIPMLFALMALTFSLVMKSYEELRYVAVPLLATPLAFLLDRFASQPRRAQLFIVVTAIELLAVTPAISHWAPRSLLERNPTPAAVIQKQQRSQQAILPVWALEKTWWNVVKLDSSDLNEETLRIINDRELLTKNTGMPRLVRYPYPFSPVRPKRWDDLFYRLKAKESPFPKLLSAFGVKRVLYIDEDDSKVLARLKPLGQVQAWQMGEYLDSADWAAFYNKVHSSESVDESIETVLRDSFNPRKECVVEAPGPFPKASITGRVILLNFSPDQVTLALPPDSGGLLVVREGMSKGWRAQVDGKETPLHYADVLYRALIVPKGSRQVVFTYKAPGWTLGLTVSLMTLLLLGLIFIHALFKRYFPTKQQDAQESP